jgi:precorrin-6B methylase 2
MRQDAQPGSAAAVDRVDALTGLIEALREAGYDFTAVTPATHQRYLAKRRGDEARTLREIFGWNLPFRPGALPPAVERAAADAGALESGGGLVKSRYRAASLGGALLLHSAFPTSEQDAVFFGPDTYRFARFLAAELPRLGSKRRAVDIGTGAGAGAIALAALRPELEIVATDINESALTLARANARAAGASIDIVEGSGLEAVTGPIDLVVANPPYVMDEEDRAYRDGGDLNGGRLSLDWALAAAKRLDPGGHMLLYTGVAIEEGRDRLREELEKTLPPLACTLRYEELDPDIFGEELEKPPYAAIERIAAVGIVIERAYS